MKRFVLDCSIAMAWCFKDEADALAEHTLDSLSSNTVIVPSIWPLEVVNALLVGERRKRISTADVAEFIANIDTLPIEIDSAKPVSQLDNTLVLARAYSLSCYDAAYLELAIRHTVPLASLDGPLVKAATAAGVTVVKV